MSGPTEWGAHNATVNGASLHIPKTQWESIEGLSVGWIPITNTIFSTWLFMIVLFIGVYIFRKAIKRKNYPKIRTVGMDIIKRLDDFCVTSLNSKKEGRRFLPLIGAFSLFIFLSNVFSLALEWLAYVIGHGATSYLRPINSDMNTTLILAVVIILVAQVSSIIYKGFFHHFKHYLFAWGGSGIAEKIINVMVGWIHFIGEFTRVLSLSVRLFANIFAGTILIAVMSYVGGLIPSAWLGLGWILVVPFWFFELFVAALQAYIFATLSLLYLHEAVTVHDQAQH